MGLGECIHNSMRLKLLTATTTKGKTSTTNASHNGKTGIGALIIFYGTIV
jgi:hypothetical protein